MKEETKEKIFKILEPVVEYLKSENIDCSPAIFRSDYGAIKVKTEVTAELLTKIQIFLKDIPECALFTHDKLLKEEYIIFSFTIDGKSSHAWG